MIALGKSFCVEKDQMKWTWIVWGGVLGAYAFGAEAEPIISAPTATVKGHAPVASSVAVKSEIVPGATIMVVGNASIAKYTFSDADNDLQSGTTAQWYRNGSAISGATSINYTPQAADKGNNLSVAVTPKTDPNSTDPSAGTTTAQSAGVMTVGQVPANWITPSTNTMNWSQANSYCQSLGGGARLPTAAELKNLFITATRSPAAFPSSGYILNYDMCDAHGWPLQGQCGGINGNYWSSTPNGAGYHDFLQMTMGDARNTNDDRLINQVACVR